MESGRKPPDVTGDTVTFLLTRREEQLADDHRVKIVVVGSAYNGVAVAIAILFKVSLAFFIVADFCLVLDSFLVTLLRLLGVTVLIEICIYSN